MLSGNDFWRSLEEANNESQRTKQESPTAHPQETDTPLWSLGFPYETSSAGDFDSADREAVGVMATLANRDWWTADRYGKPLKVRCLSQNVVLGTARVVTDDGVFAEVNARHLHHAAEDITPEVANRIIEEAA